MSAEMQVERRSAANQRVALKLLAYMQGCRVMRTRSLFPALAVAKHVQRAPVESLARHRKNGTRRKDRRHAR